jgi:hypothetical protein
LSDWLGRILGLVVKVKLKNYFPTFQSNAIIPMIRAKISIKGINIKLIGNITCKKKKMEL